MSRPWRPSSCGGDLLEGSPDGRSPKSDGADRVQRSLDDQSNRYGLLVRLRFVDLGTELAARLATHVRVEPVPGKERVGPLAARPWIRHALERAGVPREE